MDYDGDERNFTVSVDVELDNADVVEAAAKKLISTMSREMRMELNKKVAEAVEKEITHRLRDVVDDIIRQPIQPRDAFGEPIGEAKSLRLTVHDEMRAAMETTVDIYGKVAQKSAYSNTMTRAQYLLRNILTNEIAQVCRTEAKALKEQAKNAVAEAVAKAVKDNIRL